MVERIRGSVGHAAWGILLVVVSSASFGTSGAFAKSLLLAGWSSGAVVTWRVVGAALILVPVAVIALRWRWKLLLRNSGQVLAFGVVAVAGCQFAYFNAVERLSVAVALLLEYLGVVFVVLWAWFLHRRPPHKLTAIGMGLSLGGLLLVLNVFAGLQISLTGVLWGLAAAVGLAVYYVTSGRDHDESLPPISLAGFGLGVGAVTLLLVDVLGLIPYRTAFTSVVVAGHEVAWWVPIAELAIVAAALAYGIGVVGTRICGATVASFVGLSEVLFAVLIAWLLLGELPTAIQLAGGVLILAGVIAVRLGEARSEAGAHEEHVDFTGGLPVA